MLEVCAEPAQRNTPAETLSARGCTHHRLVRVEAESTQRQDVEQFVARAFARKHGASIRSFLPTLLAMRGERGQICAAAGFRCAAGQPLFLESYLQAPIEQAIAAATGRSVSRMQIVEVGNLAGSTCRAAQRLVMELPQVLLSLGQRWVVFTATRAVRESLSSHGAPLVELASARANCVAQHGEHWGRYYETDPRVMAGYLPDGLRGARRAHE